jgi:hypothetical protein
MAYFEKYYFSFYADRDTRIIGGLPDEYVCNILQLDYAGEPIEIQAQQNPIQINYQNTSNLKLDPIMGSECTLNLIATEDFQLEQLYTENEREFMVEVYRNSDLIWTGFIIPDGCQEAFTFAPYPISVNAVDGLGLLKNLSYVQNDGNFYLGKQSFIEVIQACLVRLDAPSLILNTCVNIYETSMTQGNTFDPLDMSFVNSERYLKDDQFTPMNCEEVLRSILEEWTAVMVQSGGEWYIYRPTELALSGALVFRRYLDGYSVYDSPTLTSSLDATLGGESEGLVLSPYFHINTDQMKMIDRPYKNASMSYVYGLMQNADEELDNPTFAGAINEGPNAPIGPDDAVYIPGWTKTGVVFAGTLLPVGGGVIFYSSDTIYPVDTSYYENDNIFSIQINEILKIKINYKNVDDFTQADMNFIIMFTDGLIEWFLQTDGSWGIVAIGQGVNIYSIRSESIDLASEVNIVSSVVPTSGSISFKILPPSGSGRDIIYTNISAKAYLTLDDTIGEIHTATQRGKFTFVPETINVFNGDSVNTLFAGAIYLDDQITLTERWVRRGISESILAEPYEVNKEFLRIAVEEKQRLYAGPFVQFEGSIFGYFNPLTRWSINLIDGYFMNLSLNYDLQPNVCKAVLGRIINEEIAMDYTLVPDFGETTKVTIKAT